MMRASVNTRGEHLAARGAERAQHGELAPALGDGDRERVEDDERADEHGHAAEGEQGRAQERVDDLGDVGGAVLPPPASPVLTSTEDGSSARTRAASSSGVTPGSAVTLIAVSSPRMSNQRCTSTRRAPTMIVPPSDELSPKVKMPLTVTGCRTRSPWREPIASPTATSFFSAKPASTTTSPARAGAAPSFQVTLLMAMSSAAMTKVGAPPVSTTSPSTRTALMASAPPVAVATPSTARTSASRPSGMVGPADSSSRPPRTFFGVTTAAVPL